MLCIEKYKKLYKNNKFKKSASIWNDKCELLDGSHSVLDIQGYFEYTIKKHETVTDNLPERIYVKKIENSVTVEIKTRYCLELLTPETWKR